ncbi:hypothetical protein RY279_18400 [Bacillus velezensis]|uniref:hypothetical protein n=1 Tax=Bacillus velezensis TaxID=492670 RepID=UPI003A856B73
MSIVKKGDKIGVTKEAQGHWGHIIYPVGSEWVVKEVVITPDTVTVFCKGNDYGIPQTHYKVI